MIEKNQDVSFSLNPKYQDQQDDKHKHRKGVNAQINAEFWSAYLYPLNVVPFRLRQLQGNRQLVQNPAPRGDGPCIYDDRLSRAPGRKVTLEPIADVPAEWDSPQEAFADTLAHEEKVTSMINALLCSSRGRA